MEVYIEGSQFMDSNKASHQRKSIRAISVLLFACDKTDAAACDKKEYLAKFVDSSAISTSTIRPRAARMLVLSNQRLRVEC